MVTAHATSTAIMKMVPVSEPPVFIGININVDLRNQEAPKVTRVSPGSWSYSHGIREGWLLVKVTCYTQKHGNPVPMITRVIEGTELRQLCLKEFEAQEVMNGRPLGLWFQECCYAVPNESTSSAGAPMPKQSASPPAPSPSGANVCWNDKLGDGRELGQEKSKDAAAPETRTPWPSWKDAEAEAAEDEERTPEEQREAVEAGSGARDDAGARSHVEDRGRMGEIDQYGVEEPVTNSLRHHVIVCYACCAKRDGCVPITCEVCGSDRVHLIRADKADRLVDELLRNQQRERLMAKREREAKLDAKEAAERARKEAESQRTEEVPTAAAAPKSERCATTEARNSVDENGAVSHEAGTSDRAGSSTVMLENAEESAHVEETWTIICAEHVTNGRPGLYPAYVRQDNEVTWIRPESVSKRRALSEYSMAAAAWMDANAEKADSEDSFISYDVDYGR